MKQFSHCMKRHHRVGNWCPWSWTKIQIATSFSNDRWSTNAMISIGTMWLRRRFRSIPTPKVIFGECPYGGEYFHPGKSVEIVAGQEVDTRNGVILISTTHSGDTAETASVMAHEWR